ncbi:MAG TPA: ABC transporter permease [Vicinamibacterales bacterium]|nr:ABC transporter permease [Vicinamibacterales bacterium]
MWTAIRELTATHWRLRRVLISSARVELKKRYAGSLLGLAWTVLYPLLFLSVYLFLWLVVFRVRMPGATTPLDYTVFVFGGLVPYLFLTETLSSATTSIRQNIHLVKGVIVPIELIPTRAVAVGLAAHAVGLALVVALSAVNHTLSIRVATIPAIVALEVLMLAGLSWIAAGLGVLVPDTAYLVTLATMLLMFVSPIAFRPEMVPANLRFVVWLNPVTYMADAYRGALIASYPLAGALPAFAAIAVATFAAGAAFCWRFKTFIADFE